MVGRESVNYVIHRNELQFSGYSDVTSPFFLAPTERRYTIVAEAKQKLVSVWLVLFYIAHRRQ